MQLDKKTLWHKGQLPLQLALGVLPLLLALDGSSALTRFWAGPVILALFLASSLAGLMAPGRFRLAVGAAGTAVMAGATALMCGLNPVLADVLRFAAGAVLLLAFLPLAAKRSGTELSPAVPITCGAFYLVVYAATQLGLWAIDPTVRTLFDRLLLVGFLAYMLLTLLLLSHTALDSAAANGKVPEALRRRMNLLVVGLMLLVTLLSAIPVLKRWFDAGMLWLTKQAVRLISWLASLMGQSGGGAGGGSGGGMDLSGLGANTEPSLLARILEKAAIVIALILGAAGVGLICWKLWKVLRKAIRRLLAMLRQYTAAASEDYVDEVASTLDDADHERAAILRRARRARRRTDERTMTPAQLIRWRYQQLRSRHPEWREADTARDTLPEQAAEVYERARYSDHEVTQADAERLTGLK